MDLVYLGVSAKLAGAVKVDAGQLTEDQFDTQVAALRARVAEEEQRRRTAHESDRTTTVPANSLLAGLPAFETAANPSPGTAGPVIAISADPTMASAAAPSEPPPPLPRPEAPEQRIAALTPPPPLPAAAAPPPADVPMARASGPGYRLQFGVFAREDNATRLTKAIGSPQTRIAVETGQDRAGHPLYYVRSGVYPDLDKAQAAAKAAQASAQSQGFKEEVSYVVLAVGDAH
jgi:septal ring-binding cell division protein DamX